MVSIVKHNLILLSVLMVFGCRQKAAENPEPLFTLLSPDVSGISFSNDLTEGLNTNVLMYEYFYNGGGVAAGDLNGDGLDDLYFVSNMGENRLYLNKGDMKFDDISIASGAMGRTGPWKTGVSIADINGDGKLDIYLCYSGKLPDEKRKNQLFINTGNDADGIPQFEDQAERYKVNSAAYSTQAYFFDFDRDGDLDMILLNHNPNSLPVLDDITTAEILKMNSAAVGVRLFQNEGEFFSDVTEAAGISSSELTYGLGLGISDINGDGWPDFYICNDYSVPDYLYINNKNGTFTDELQTYLGHTSHFSMGNDIADINNDALPDIYSLDMLPEDNRRQKLLFAPDNYEKFALAVRSGFYYQYMRNMLHVNNGNGTFSEIGQLAGISNTDWSWAPLFADYDNDGWKDLFVTNGFTRDFTNLDFSKYMSDVLKDRKMMREDVFNLVQKIPSSAVENYFFRNNGDLTFENVSSTWSANQPSNSNGAVYTDLDNDGDLDLVVNNINQPAFIYQNKSKDQNENNSLSIQLKGSGKNTLGIGSNVTLYVRDKLQYQEQMPNRGYQSSVSPVLNFGIGNAVMVDSIRIVWPRGKQQLIRDIKANQLLVINEQDAVNQFQLPAKELPVFTEVSSPVAGSQSTNPINDFKRQPLMINPLSFSGPCLAKADVNGDGLEDIYVGGAAGEPGQLFIQDQKGKFKTLKQSDLEIDLGSHDADAMFFDANGDGFPDLYVVSGGYHNFVPDDQLLQDRLYINNGQGKFTRDHSALPAMTSSKSCVRLADIDGDGSLDLFVGGRVIPGRYPETPESYLLINDGHGKFSEQTNRLSPELKSAGMVTDAIWIDMNKDKRPDLVIAGEWMPVMVMINEGGKLVNRTADYFDQVQTGWWNKIFADDFNQDGFPDLIVGNEGLNTQCKASVEQPAEIFYKDFDANGAVDPIFCFYIQNKSYPYISRDELLDQLSITRPRFPSYESYADATLTDIFTAEELKDVKRLTANNLSTSYFLSDKTSKLKAAKLPLAVQSSPVFTITKLDFNNDGHPDLLLCGNINKARLRFGKSDANYGILLKGDGKGNFSYVDQQLSGFKLKGDVRSVIEINDQLLFGINQIGIKAYQKVSALKQ